jgi:hypothetical protein
MRVRNFDKTQLIFEYVKSSISNGWKQKIPYFYSFFHIHLEKIDAAFVQIDPVAFYATLFYKFVHRKPLVFIGSEIWKIKTVKKPIESPHPLASHDRLFAFGENMIKNAHVPAFSQNDEILPYKFGFRIKNPTSGSLVTVFYGDGKQRITFGTF